MITLTSTGKAEELDNGLARTSSSAANDFETGATEDLRDFITALRKRFGKNATFSVHTNGNLDHGGGLIQFTINVANYPDEVEEAKNEPAAYDRPELVVDEKKEDSNLVSKEEMDTRAKERDAKGTVTKDKSGNQVAGVKPAIAEIKK